MDIEEYATNVRQFAVYKSSNYPHRALREEIGEVHGVFAKADRGDYEHGGEEFCQKLLKEVGDCYWMINEIVMLPQCDWDNPGGIEDFEVDDVQQILDVLWERGEDFDTIMVNELADLLAWYGLDYQDALQMNYEKLAGRQETGKIQGEGDDR